MYSLQIIIKRSDSKLKEPPYTERYVRWCERTDRELIPIFLLDLPFMGLESLEGFFI